VRDSWSCRLPKNFIFSSKEHDLLQGAEFKIPERTMNSAPFPADVFPLASVTLLPYTLITLKTLCLQIHDVSNT
jgi:hypothetical protein